MPNNKIDKLIDDIKDRPVPYATVALGFAAAIILTSRLVRGDRSTVSKLADRSIETLQHGRNEALKHLPDLSDLSVPGERGGKEASQASISQSAVAVFLGTLLAKGVIGLVKRQDELTGPSQRTSLPGVSSKDLGDQLNEMTVAELREIATERDLVGRSSMNKSELVEALGR